MKALFFSAVFFAAAVAGAEVKNQVQDLSYVEYKQGTLTYGYVVGGGCQEHTTEFEVEFVEVTEPYAHTQAVLKVFDVTEQPDFCEALIPVSGSVDVTELIKEAQVKAGIDQYSMPLVLPPVIYIP